MQATVLSQVGARHLRCRANLDPRLGGPHHLPFSAQGTCHQGRLPAPPVARNSQPSVLRAGTRWEARQKELARGPPAHPSLLPTALPQILGKIRRAPWLSAPVPHPHPTPKNSPPTSAHSALPTHFSCPLLTWSRVGAYLQRSVPPSSSCPKTPPMPPWLCPAC